MVGKPLRILCQLLGNRIWNQQKPKSLLLLRKNLCSSISASVAVFRMIWCCFKILMKQQFCIGGEDCWVREELFWHTSSDNLFWGCLGVINSLMLNEGEKNVKLCNLVIGFWMIGSSCASSSSLHLTIKPSWKKEDSVFYIWAGNIIWNISYISNIYVSPTRRYTQHVGAFNRRRMHLTIKICNWPAICKNIVLVLSSRLQVLLQMSNGNDSNYALKEHQGFAQICSWKDKYKCHL